MRVNEHIRTLKLANARIGAAGSNLCSELGMNRTLTHLDLSGNLLGAPVARSLAAMLRANSSLLHLDVSNNGFTVDTVETMVEDGLSVSN